MNNQTIKFRVYCLNSNRYFNDSFSNQFAIGQNGDLYRYSDHDNWDSAQCNRIKDKERENYVVQFFTGQKDKNKKEIFEGDIVNVNGGNHIIEYRGAGFAATWSDYNLDTCWFVGGAPVVVGNIFENPELAEKARKSPRI